MNNNKSVLARRALLLAALTLPAGACTTSGLFGQNQSQPRHTLSPRGDRLVLWIQKSGKDNMMAPEALALMDITNEGRDIPVRQIAQEEGESRFVVSLTNIRKIHDLIFMRRQGDVSAAASQRHQVHTACKCALSAQRQAFRDHRHDLRRKRFSAADRFLVQGDARSVVV